MAVATDAAIRERLERAGLGQLAPRVLAEVRTEVRITSARTASFALGQSRIGGAPDLPPGTAWPRHRWSRTETEIWPAWARRDLDVAIGAGVVAVEGEVLALALAFVAQLDLAELAPLQSVLPRRGHLWLFADQQTTLGEIGGYPHCACACLYAAEASAAELVRAVPPPVPERLAAHALAFAAARSLPEAGELDLGDDDGRRYTAAVADLAQPEPRHACLSRSEYGSIAPVPPADYTAILRVDSDGSDDVAINWGDAAWITFAIPDAGLAAQRFDEVRGFRWIG